MNMPKVTQRTARVLEVLWTATNGSEVDLDQAGYLHFHAERIGKNALAMSHTFVQNGDLMRDPEVVFFRACEGVWYVVNCTQDPVGLFTLCAEHDEHRITRFSPRAMRDVTSFANMWAKNLVVQFPEVAAMMKRAA